MARSYPNERHIQIVSHERRDMEWVAFYHLTRSQSDGLVSLFPALSVCGSLNLPLCLQAGILIGLPPRARDDLV